jgi:hypothetical protein
LEIKPPASTRFVPATVEVSIPGTAPSIALQEQSLLSGSVTVNGSPIQSGADPAVSATVRATEVTGANQGNSATVNPDGTYQLALAPGTYNIAVNYWLGESWRGTWINFATWSHPGPQNLKFNADMTTNIDLPLHELTGIVKDADGNPLSNVDLSYSNGSTTTSQAPGFEGTYKLYFLQGTYALEVRPPAATRYVATSVEVSIPGTAPSIELQKQALLSGSITVNGSMLPPEMMASMAGATVRATETNGANQGNTVEVDSDGTYRMALSPGTYNISVDYWFGEDWHGTSINYGSWGYPGARNLSVTTDISQDIDIPLHVLSGTVKDISGNPVSDVQLNYSGPYSNGTIKTSAEAGFEGTYKLYFLPGTYSVQVNAPPALYPPFQVKRVTIIEDATRNIVLGNDYSVLEQAIAMIPPHLELHLDVFDILTDEPDKVYDLAISSHRDLAQIIINWADGDMQASVYRPNGTLYGQYQADNGPIVLDIQNPEIGTWTCEITAMAISQDDNFPVAIVVALTPSQPPVADADGPYSSMAGTPVTLDASNSFDPDGAIVLYEWDLDNDGVFDQNTTHSSISHIWHKAYAGTVRLRVTDDEGHVDIACVSVQVSATTAPDITLTVSRDTLWPPNHKMVPITVDVSAADLDPEAVCHITAVSSNESEDGLGDGHTAPDWEIIADLTVNLRAERSGPASGRIYTITVECIDATGAMASAEAEVAVPHDQGKKNGKK